MRKETFALRLRKALEMREMSQKELSQRTGINESSISTYLKGEYTARQKKVDLMAEALRVDPAWLMGFDVPPNKSQPKPTTDEDLPQLTPRDERQIAKELEAMMNDLDAQTDFAAHGGTIEDEEDRELLRASLLTTMKLAKQLAKKKYTPKKFRK